MDSEYATTGETDLYTPPRPRLTIAEDDTEIRFALTEVLAQDGFEVTSVPDGHRLVEHLVRCRQRARYPDVLLLDHRMPGWCGLEVLRDLRSTGWHVPVIIMTAFGAEVLEAAHRLGACAVFEKPFDADDLRTAVRYWANHEPVSLARAMAAETPTCGSCGTVHRVGQHPPFGGAYFCDECWSQSSPPHPDHELGVVD